MQVLRAAVVSCDAVGFCSKQKDRCVFGTVGGNLQTPGAVEACVVNDFGGQVVAVAVFTGPFACEVVADV